MKIKEVKAFETDDGSLFVRKEEALRHYRERMLRKALMNQGYTPIRANHFVNRLQELMRRDPEFKHILEEYLAPSPKGYGEGGI